MGWFSRKENAPAGRGRPMISSEAQAAELRARARRRLVGAIALVLIAVVVLPMVLNPEPDRVAEDIPIRLPEPPQAAAPVAIAPSMPQADSGQSVAGVDLGVAGVPPPPPLSSAPAGHAVGQQIVPPPPLVAATTPPQPDVPPLKPDPKPIVPKPVAPNRSDDGARAIALLEGRDASPAPVATPRAAEKGNFVLQIASYSARGDADGRREKLHAAGVTNAFVQAATVSGREQFRLRVGPFPSRDAAQAAQARLRTLGYDNGFIAAQ